MSKLKDARWQLASNYAVEDGHDFYNMPHYVQDRYLEAARTRLAVAGDGMIERLAAEFNKEDS